MHRIYRIVVLMNECLCYKQIDRERMKREQEREDGRKKQEPKGS